MTNKIGSKKCTKCAFIKSLNDFYFCKHANGRHYPKGMCKKCTDAYIKPYHKKYSLTRKFKDKKNKKRNSKYLNDFDYREALKKRKRESRIRNIETSILSFAKSRAKKKNIEFNIEKLDIIVPKICPILEIPIKFGDRTCYFNSPSLDRIDVSKGYIKGNIRVISMLANSMKNAATIEQIKVFCKNILIYIENKDIVQTIEKFESIESENKES